MITAAHCVDFGKNTTNGSSNVTVISFRTDESMMKVFVGLHHTANKARTNVYLVKKIIVVFYLYHYLYLKCHTVSTIFTTIY